MKNKKNFNKKGKLTISKTFISSPYANDVLKSFYSTFYPIEMKDREIINEKGIKYAVIDIVAFSDEFEELSAEEIEKDLIPTYSFNLSLEPHTYCQISNIKRNGDG